MTMMENVPFGGMTFEKEGGKRKKKDLNKRYMEGVMPTGISREGNRIL